MILAGWAAFGLTGCDRSPPTGQVVATVDGKDVTLGELRAEAALDSQPGAVARAQPGLLRAVVDRKLWAGDAQRTKLDQDVQFILARRRAEEAQLARLDVETLSASVAPPSNADVDRFLRRLPKAYRDRTVFLVEQIGVNSNGDTRLAAKLAQATSLEEVEALLKSRGVIGQRSRTEWNSTFMPASLAERLRKLPPDGLIFQSKGDTLISAKVVAKTTVPLGDADRRILARQSLTQQKVRAAIAVRLADLRAAADIRVQPGYSIDPR